MKVAVIILNYNSEEDTIRYVNEIEQYNCINRIVVVDNFSTNKDTMEKLLLLKNEKVHVIQTTKNGGYSYGNNQGLKYLDSLNEKYDYIFISNPDVEVKEEVFLECIKELEENEKTAICTPRMYDSKENPIRRSSWKIRTPKIDMANSTRLTQILLYKLFKSGEYSSEEFENNARLKVEAVTGAFFAIKYDVFKKCDFFDENVFLFYEEDILATKIKKLGYEAYSLNNVGFIHYESNTINKVFSYFNKIKRLQKSKMYYQKEYNHINNFQVLIFNILNIWKRIELLIEIPIRKLGSK